MRRVTTILLVAGIVLFGAVSTALAHELQVLPPGPAELDLGLLSRELLVHATIQDASDELQVTVLAPSDAETWFLEVLVPDAEPERSTTSEALPNLRIGTPDSGTGGPISPTLAVRDQVTGVRYLVAAGEGGGLPFEAGSRRVVTITCDHSGPACGERPTRVALRVYRDDGVGFAAQDVERTRQTVARVVEWSTAGAQDRTDRAGSSDLSPRLVAWFGAGIALLGLLVALWWVARGRRASRVRGAERAAEKRANGADVSVE